MLNMIDAKDKSEAGETVKWENGRKLYHIPSIDRWLTLTEMATLSGLKKQSVSGRIKLGKRGDDLIAPSATEGGKNRPPRWMTPKGGWSDWALYWLRQGLSPRGNAYDYTPKPIYWNDDGRRLNPHPGFVDSKTGEPVGWVPKSPQYTGLANGSSGHVLSAELFNKVEAARASVYAFVSDDEEDEDE